MVQWTEEEELALVIAYQQVHGQGASTSQGSPNARGPRWRQVLAKFGTLVGSTNDSISHKFGDLKSKCKNFELAYREVRRDLPEEKEDVFLAFTHVEYRRKPVASTINTLAGALYKVFSASPEQARTELRQACFDYLSLGGMFSEGPIALLSGLNPKPWSLVLHFFSVAVFGVGRILLPFPSPQRIQLGVRLILDASGIILPILKSEGGGAAVLLSSSTPTYYKSPFLH